MKQTKQSVDFKNGINLTKKVKSGQLIKHGVSENEFVKMVKAGSVEQLKVLSDENQRLKETIAQMISRIREITFTNILEPIQKANPVLYTDIRQLIDPLHEEI